MINVRNCAHLGRDMRRRLQTIVSVNKRRSAPNPARIPRECPANPRQNALHSPAFIDRDIEVDLDLTYIADRVIGHALPCVDSAVYRNDIRQ
eukprot:3255284-Rhodomonas_salina.2